MISKIVAALVVLGMMVSVVSAEVVSKNGIAKDTVTRLMWQDEPYTEAEKVAYDKNTNNEKAGNWEYVKGYCEDLRLGGYKDWRLPNIYEISTLLDNTKSSNPYVIDGIKNMVSHLYWSSTTNASNSNHAWVVGFDYGFDTAGIKTSSMYVRCVRAGQLSFDSLALFKKQGNLKVTQKVIENISPSVEAKRKKEAEIAAKENAKKEAKEQAERDRQAEYDRKHQCDGFYPGKNFKVHTTGLFGGDEKARITGVDKDGGQVSFEWYDGAIREWRQEETTCTYLKTQMR